VVVGEGNEKTSLLRAPYFSRVTRQNFLHLRGDNKGDETGGGDVVRGAPHPQKREKERETLTSSAGGRTTSTPFFRLLKRGRRSLISGAEKVGLT